MKSHRTTTAGRLARHHIEVAFAVAMVTNAFAMPASAAVWLPSVGGTWGAAANWSPAAVPSGSDVVADFTGVNPTADATVTLDGDRTVGTLKFGDIDTTSAAGWVLAGSTATPASNFIVFQTASGPATIDVGPLGVGKVVAITAKMKSTATQEVIKTGVGTLTLGYGTGTGVSQADNFLGILTMQQGTVQFSNAFQLPVFAADRMVFNGGTLSYNGSGGLTTGRIFTLGAGGGELDSNGTGAVNLSGAGATVLSGNGARTFTLGGTYTATTNTFASLLGDGIGGATSIVKVGAGAWNLSNASNSFTGNITVNGGTLQAAILGGGTVSMAANSTFVLSRSTGLTSNIPITGAGNLGVNVGNNQLNLTNANFTGTTNIQVGTYLNNNANTSNFTLGVTNANVTSYGVLGLTTADFNAPLGTTGGGITWLSSGGFSAIGAGTRVVNIGGNATPDTVTLGVGGFYAGSNSTSDQRFKFGDTSGASAGTVDFRNNLVLNSRAFKTVTDGSATVAGILSGDISGTGRADGTLDAVVKFGNGNLKLAGNNTYSGATNVGGTGAVILGSAGAFSPNSWMLLNGGSAGTAAGVLGLGYSDLSANLGTTGGSVAWPAAASGGFAAYGGDRKVTLNGGAALSWGSTPSFVATGQNLILALASSDGVITLDNPLNLNAGARTIVVNDGSSAVDAAINQVISGASGSGLTKAGAGTLVLGGANSYVGNTTVSAGTLLVNGSINAGSPTTGAVGTTIGGTGSFGDNVTINGKLAPGASAGSLEIAGNLTLGSTASTVIEIGGTSFTLNAGEDYDRVKLTSATPTVAIAGALNVSLITTLALADNMAFGIVQLGDGATRTGTFAGLPTDGSLVGTFGGSDLYITYSGNVADAGTVAITGGNDIVLYTNVPEPTAIAASGLAATAMLRRRRRQMVR